MTRTPVEQELLHLFQERSSALVHKDIPVLERLLAEEFRYINASGMVLTKAEYLHHYVAAPDVRWLSQDADDMVVQVYGETAVITGRVHDQGHFGPEPFDAYYRSTFVWVRRDGIWRCVIGQTTTAMQPE